VVTCFLMRRGLLLILRRSETVGTYRCKWAGVSGHVEKGEAPSGTAFREILEETGLSSRDIELRRAGAPLPIALTNFVVHPFLFEVGKGRIRTDWEHTAHRWIRPSELRRFGTVPGLAEALRSVLRESSTLHSARVKSLSSSPTSKRPSRAAASSHPCA